MIIDVLFHYIYSTEACFVPNMGVSIFSSSALDWWSGLTLNHADHLSAECTVVVYIMFVSLSNVCLTAPDEHVC